MAMFKRMFGSSKPAAPPPTLDDATKKVNERGDALDMKIKKLDQELIQLREQMKKMRPGGPQNSVKARALRVLKQKKMYEQQREQLYGQAFNMEQANFASQTMQDTVTTVAAMKAANSSMKSQMKTVDVNDIENTLEDMQDLLEDTNEIQDLLSRSFATPDVDEADLDDELAALGDELAAEESVPSYLEAAAPPSAEPSVSAAEAELAALGSPAAALPQTSAVKVAKV